MSGRPAKRSPSSLKVVVQAKTKAATFIRTEPEGRPRPALEGELVLRRYGGRRIQLIESPQTGCASGNHGTIIEQIVDVQDSRPGVPRKTDVQAYSGHRRGFRCVCELPVVLTDVP